MKKVIFSTLKQNINSLEKDYRQQYGDADIINCKLAALKEIKAYIEGYAKTNDRVRAYLHNECSCKKTAELLNIKASALQMYITRKSELLEIKIGSETVDLVLKAETVEGIDDVMQQLRLNKTKEVKPNLFIKEVFDMFPKAKYSSNISMKDCIPELGFLKSLTRSNLNKRIRSVNPMKIAHILAILEGDSVYDSDLRDNIYKRLESSIKLD